MHILHCSIEVKEYSKDKEKKKTKQTTKRGKHKFVEILPQEFMNSWRDDTVDYKHSMFHIL